MSSALARPADLSVFWLGVAGLGILAVGGLGDLTGVEVGFFVFYFLPVTLAGWRAGVSAAVGASLLSGAVWMAADLSGGAAYSHPSVLAWNAIVRLAALLAIGWAAARIRTLLDHERHLTTELTAALDEVRTLKGLLPVCAWCSRVQDENGTWLPIDRYIRSHTDAQVSHGLCESCAKTMLE